MSCLICDRIAQIKVGENRHFVAELQTGYVVLGDFQFFRGYTLFLGKTHVAELHELPADTRTRFLVEMSQVAEAVYRCFQPRKLNYECLGNAEPHLHWHLFPRHHDDPSPGTPSWIVDHSIRYAEAYRPTDEAMRPLRQSLLDSLRAIPGIAIQSSAPDA